MKIGILGGTFNPIHNGHLIIAEGVRLRYGLDRVLFIPCHTPYHKKLEVLVSPQHRLNMVKSAVRGNPYFKVSNIDIQRGGITYSIDTVRELQGQYLAKFYFIIGQDSLRELPLWKDIEILTRWCRFIVVRRGNMPVRLPRPLVGAVLFMKNPLIEISSSNIRKCVKEEQSIKYLVPDAVERYIKKYHLYRS